MAAVIAAVVGSLVVAFGLGVAVGLLQPKAAQAPTEVVASSVAEPTLVVSKPPAGGEPTPVTLATSRAGEFGVAPEPPLIPGTTAPLSPSPGFETTGAPAPSPTPSPTEPSSPTPEPTVAPLPARSPVPTAEVAVGLWVQLGSLSQAQQGEGLRVRAVAMGFTPEQVVVLRSAEGRFLVRVGPFPDRESAGRVVARLRTQGFPDAFVVRE